MAHLLLMTQIGLGGVQEIADPLAAELGIFERLNLPEVPRLCADEVKCGEWIRQERCRERYRIGKQAIGCTGEEAGEGIGTTFHEWIVERTPHIVQWAEQRFLHIVGIVLPAAFILLTDIVHHRRLR